MSQQDKPGQLIADEQADEEDLKRKTEHIAARVQEHLAKLRKSAPK